MSVEALRTYRFQCDATVLAVSCTCGARLGEAKGGAKTRWQQHVRGER